MKEEVWEESLFLKENFDPVYIEGSEGTRNSQYNDNGKYIKKSFENTSY